MLSCRSRLEKCVNKLGVDIAPRIGDPKED